MKMKVMKRFSSILLALVMMLAMVMTVSATGTTPSEGADTPKGSYTMKINTVANHTYKIYQLATGDVSSDGKKLSNIAVGANAKEGTDVAAIQALKDLSEAELGDAALALIDEESTPVEVVGTGEMQEVTLEGGYYVIVDTYTDGENVALGDSISRTMVELVEDTEVKPKTVQITPDKKILDCGHEHDESCGFNAETGTPCNHKHNEDCAELLDSSEASIGDTITYRLMGTVADMTGYKSFVYVMVDTLSPGLTVDYQENNVVKGVYGSKEADFKVTAVTKNTDGSTTVRFALVNAIQYKGEAPNNTVGSVYIDIQAKLNQNAVITPSGNLNKMDIEYSNKPGHGYEGDDFDDEDPKGTTVEKEVNTYTTELTITKTDENGEALTGAKFKLTGTGVNVGYATGQEFVVAEAGYGGEKYYKLVDGAYTKQAPKEDGSDKNKYADGNIYKLIDVDKPADLGTVDMDAEAFVGEDGKVTFSGLGAGKYTISEIVVPDGYNGIKDINFTVTWTKENGFAVTDITEGYKIAVAEEGTILSTIIKNQSGTELPSTGGIGTTIFYVVGGILVVGAVVLLVVKKRMSHQA